MAKEKLNKLKKNTEEVTGGDVDVLGVPMTEALPSDIQEDNLVPDKYRASTGQVADQVPTFEVLANSGVKGLSEIVGIKKIAELRKSYMPLVISGLSDKEGLEKVRKAHREMVGLRNRLNEKRLSINKLAREYIKKVDEAADNYKEEMLPIEEHLSGEIDKYEKEKKRIDDEKQEALNRKITERHERLVKAGMARIGMEYLWTSSIDALSSQSVFYSNLELMDDEEFEPMFKSISDVIENENRVIEEEKKKREEEAEKLKKEKEQFEEEKRKMKISIYEARSTTLQAIGFTKNKDWSFSLSISYPEKIVDINLTKDEVVDKTSDEWNEVVSDAGSQLAEAKKLTEQAEIDKKDKERAEFTYNNRVAQLVQLGMLRFVDGSYRYGDVRSSEVDIKRLSEDTWKLYFGRISDSVSEVKKAEEEQAEVEKKEREKESVGKVRFILIKSLVNISTKEDAFKLSNLSEEDFQSLYSKYKNQDDGIKKQKLIDEAIEVNSKSRLKLLSAISVEYDDLKELGSMSDSDWAVYYSKKKSAYDNEVNEKNKADMLAAMSDKNKFIDYCKSVLALTVPDFKTKKYTNSVDSIKDFINKLIQ